MRRVADAFVDLGLKDAGVCVCACVCVCVGGVKSSTILTVGMASLIVHADQTSSSALVPLFTRLRLHVSYLMALTPLSHWLSAASQ
jgi:hypothetical protein